jgi:hypothetical protein
MKTQNAPRSQYTLLAGEQELPTGSGWTQMLTPGSKGEGVTHVSSCGQSVASVGSQRFRQFPAPRQICPAGQKSC